MPEESDLIAATAVPATPASLARDLRELGLNAGDVVITHSSLSALGWVAGGAQSVVEALFTVLGPEGTLCMPTHSGQLSDPAEWSNPPVPETWVEMLRAGLPAFDPDLTSTLSMGRIVECFRQHANTMRSVHPTLSFAANGPLADNIVGKHPLSPALGETSPLGRLYELDARVLLLGVSHAHDTSLHLAEHRAEWTGKEMATEGAPVMENGGRTWVTYEDLSPEEHDLESIGEAFLDTGRERVGPVGTGRARLCQQRAIIDFAVGWMEHNRPGSLER